MGWAPRSCDVCGTAFKPYRYRQLRCRPCMDPEREVPGYTRAGYLRRGAKCVRGLLRAAADYLWGSHVGA